MDLRHYDDPFQYLTVDNLLTEERISELDKLAQLELDRFYSTDERTAMGKYVRYLDEDILPEVDFLYDILPHRPASNNIKKIIHWCICPAGEWASSSGRPHLDPIARVHTSTMYLSPNIQRGTMVCKNNAPSDWPGGDDKALSTSNPSEYEIEVPWKKYRVFSINCMDGMWHYFASRGDEPRVTLQTFLVDIDKLVNINEPWPSVKDSNWIDYVRSTV